MRMPARRLFIFSLVFSTPVRQPATNPAPMPQAVARPGSMPSTMSRAQTAPPRGKLPSTVRSGKASTLKVSAMPRATKAYPRPCSRVMGKTPSKNIAVRSVWEKIRGLYGLPGDQCI